MQWFQVDFQTQNVEIEDIMYMMSDEGIKSRKRLRWGSSKLRRKFKHL